MSYCTLDDLLSAVDEAWLIQITDDEGDGDIYLERVDAAIAASTSEIDGYLRGVATLPLATTPPLLRRIAVQTTLYHLSLRRRGLEQAYSEEYKHCLTLLKDLAAGKLQLQPPPETITPGLRYDAL